MGVRGVKPTPVETMELRGAYLKNPQRRKSAPPKNTRPMGEPFAWMTEAESATWREMALDLPPGVATATDRWMFSVWVRLMTRFSAGEKLSVGELNQARQLASMFGASPADRARLALPKSPEKDELEDEFFGEN